MTWQDWREPDLIPSPRVQQMLQSNVVHLHASEDVFEAFRDDGTKISWGEAGSSNERPNHVEKGILCEFLKRLLLEAQEFAGNAFPSPYIRTVAICLPLQAFSDLKVATCTFKLTQP